MNEDIKKLINDACNQIKPIKIKQIIFNDDGLEEVKEVEYATVNERLKAYRQVFPTGQISTKLENLENDKEYITIKAHVMDDNFKVLATGYAREKLTEDGLEKCETSAIGRALAFAGFNRSDSISSYDENINKEVINNPKKKSNKKTNKNKDELTISQKKWMDKIKSNSSIWLNQYLDSINKKQNNLSSEEVSKLIKDYKRTTGVTK